MKLLKLTFFIALIGAFLGFSSCGSNNNPDPSIEEAQLKKLVGTWVINKAQFAGSTDSRTEYAGMTLTLTGTFDSAPGATYEYSLSGRPTLSPWPASGTWRFEENDPESLIIRTEDDLLITYLVTANTLQLSFDYEGKGAGYAGRTSAINDDWIFLFDAQ